MIPLFKTYVNNDAINNCSTTLSSGMLTQAKQVDNFENKLSEFFNYNYLLTLNSCTSALTLALKICDLKKDDEVLTSPLTCFASTSAIISNNYKLKWVDVDKNNCNIDLMDLERKINENTKVILYVLWAGTPLNIEKLYDIKETAEKKYNTKITIIQDCAHAFGSTYNNYCIGTDSRYPAISCYSFQAIKHLTTADGGAILLPNKELYERCKLLRWYGIDRSEKMLTARIEQNILESGYKFHMNDVNASIGLGNLPGAIENVKKHNKNALYLFKNLQNIKGVELMPYNYGSAYWIYTLFVSNLSSFKNYMTSKSIGVNQVHTRNDTHECVKQYKTELLNLSQIEKQFISIPCGWWLTNDQLYHIVESIKEWSSLEHDNFVIRKLQTSDKKEYLNLLSQLSGMNYKEEDYNTKLMNNNEYIYVLIKDNKILSTAKLIIETKFADNIGHIEDVVTDNSFRGQGYGKKIINYLCQKASEFNVYKIVLHTKVPKFYGTCGFKQEGYSMTKRLK